MTRSVRRNLHGGLDMSGDVICELLSRRECNRLCLHIQHRIYTS